MSEINPAYVIGPANNTAQVFRNTLEEIYNSGTYGGVTALTDLKVTATTGLGISIALGSAIVPGTHSGAVKQGSYMVTSTTAVTKTLGTTGSQAQQKDLIIARVRDADYGDSGASPFTLNTWAIEVVPGTVNNTAPTPSAGSYIVLAEVLHSTTAVTTVTDKRTVASPASGPSTVDTGTLANDVAARGTSGMTAGEGSVVYQTSNPPGLLINYGGTAAAYNPPWNLPWGVVSTLFMPYGTSAAITGTAVPAGWSFVNMTFSPAAGNEITLLKERRYKITASIPEVASNTTGDVVSLQIVSGVLSLNRTLAVMASGSSAVSMTVTAYTQAAQVVTGGNTITVNISRPAGTGNVTCGSTSAAGGMASLIVEDVGPLTNPLGK